MALQHFIQLLEPFQLTKAEVVGILNLCPSSAVELHLVVEDCETRLNEEQASVQKYQVHHSPAPQLRHSDNEARGMGRGGGAAGV
ncbi:RPOL4c domain-containing protein, partial [Haematococcus lacustris]